MNGVINVFKPPGWTSHDVVNRVRRVFGIRKVGHAGTLDPGAAGVLVVLVGRATRTQQYFTALGKTYVGELTLGIQTDSGDGFGSVITVDETPPDDPGVLEDLLLQFTGEVEQLPPMTSAVKHQGEPLYRLARRGVTVKRKIRRVRIDALRLLHWNGSMPPRALLEIRCSSGTYVRTLMMDLATAAGSCGYMSFLVRTAVGSFAICDAIWPGDICREALVPLSEALDFLPALCLDSSDARRVSGGARPQNLGPVEGCEGDRVRLVGPKDALLAVGRVSAGRVYPEKVFLPPGD